MYFDRKDDIYFIKWAKQVKIRDHFTCQICGQRGVLLNAHHMDSWDVHEDLRYDLDNGVTLCDFHHKGFHDIYGYGQNTRLQFEEFRKLCETMIDVANNDIQTANIIKKVNEDIILADVLKQFENDLGREDAEHNMGTVYRDDDEEGRGT